MRLTGRRVVTPDGVVDAAAVEIDSEGRIVTIEPARPGETVADHVLVPGYIDIQNNGDAGVSCATADGDDWDALDAALLSGGVTTWFPTLVTAPLASYGAALDRVEAAQRRPAAGRPAIGGVHLEGPFLGGAPGAHDPTLIQPPDLGWLRSLPGIVRIVTLAPEAPAAVEAVAELAARGVTVALGHSRASAEQTVAAVAAGAALVTHLFNGMSPFHHRDPGLVGVALTDGRLTISLIADVVHVDPVAIRLAFTAKGPGGVVLVSDTVAGATRRRDGTLAGGTARLGACVANAIAAGIDVTTAVAAASAVPARLLGLDDRGQLLAGRRADIAALDPHTYEVQAVWVAGGLAWERPG